MRAARQRQKTAQAKKIIAFFSSAAGYAPKKLRRHRPVGAAPSLIQGRVGYLLARGQIPQNFPPLPIGGAGLSGNLQNAEAFRRF
jgi:hypothetical protein